MGRFDKKNPKLSEVKAVLERLQGLPTEADPGSPLFGASDSRSTTRRTGIFTAVLVVSAVGVFGTVYVFVGSRGKALAPAPSGAASTAPRAAAAPAAPSAAAPAPPRLDPAKEPEVKVTLEGARALMAKGRVRAARQQLLTFAEQGSPDAAWDLARSYDPNVLGALPAADGTPNVKEAERWYRAWYAAAVQQGLVADSVSLERIVRSMNQ